MRGAMDPRQVARANGLVFIGSVLGTIVLLVVGLGIASWFTADGAVVESTGNDAFGPPSTEFALAKINACSYGRCVSTWTFEFADGAFGKLALATLALGSAFGALVLWFANRRIASAEVPAALKWLGYALAIATLTTSLLCMFAYPPEAMAYEVVTSGGSLLSSPSTTGRTLAITTEPTRGLGGSLAIAGLLLGSLVVWGARTTAKQPEPEVEPRTPRRSERSVAARGPETDPFRAAPAPPPIATVRHPRPWTATPVVDDPSDEPPKLLR